MNNLAIAYLGAGRLDVAISLLEEVLKDRRAKLGEDHPDTLNIINNVASAYQRKGQLDRAIPLYERTLSAADQTGRGPSPDAHFSQRPCPGLPRSGPTRGAIPLFEQVLKGATTQAGGGPSRDSSVDEQPRPSLEVCESARSSDSAQRTGARGSEGQAGGGPSRHAHFDAESRRDATSGRPS